MEEATPKLDEGNEKWSSFPDSEAKERGGITALEGSKILVSPKRDAKRKRGRPAGGSVNKGKKHVGQAQRTRARIVKKPAKICENESDESSSFDEKTNKEEIEMSEGNDEIQRAVGKDDLEIRQTEIMDDLESLCRCKAAEDKVSGESRCEEWFNKAPDVEMGERNNRQEEGNDKAPVNEMGDRHGDQVSEKPEKLEVMVDPVQAILMDMIPSLGMKKVETINPILHDEKPAAVGPSEQPVKKKKVSYKDIAAKLLKD